MKRVKRGALCDFLRFENRVSSMFFLFTVALLLSFFFFKWKVDNLWIENKYKYRESDHGVENPYTHKG